MKNNLNIVFFGTPEFSNIVLEKLIKSPYKPSLVITVPDKVAGRKKELTPPPLKSLILEHKTWNIKILQPEILDESFKFQVSSFKPKLFIVAAYGKIIPQEILNIPSLGTLNIHPSLLPRYRGPSPIQNTILNSDRKTGVTIILMDEKMDHGPIIKKQAFAVSKNETYETLGNNLFRIGADLLINTLPKYVENKIKPKNQNHKKATYTKIINRENGNIDWNNSAVQISNQLRAFTPWPGIYTTWNNKRFKILSLSTTKSPNNVTIGKVIKQSSSFAVATSNGLIIPKEIQLEGKKIQNAKEFLNGHPSIIGSILK